MAGKNDHQFKSGSGNSFRPQVDKLVICLFPYRYHDFDDELALILVASGKSPTVPLRNFGRSKWVIMLSL
jgi:hypothetical protein